MQEYSKTIPALLGVIGSVIANQLGGWDTALATLLVFMATDFVTGLLVAGVFHHSNKTENGALKSDVSFRGLLRKGMILAVVLVSAQLDLLLGAQYVRDAVVIAYVVNETLSIIENAGLMGVPLPEILVKAVDILRAKGENHAQNLD